MKNSHEEAQKTQIDKEFISHRFHRLHRVNGRFLTAEVAESAEVFSQLCVLGKICLQSELCRKSLLSSTGPMRLA